MISKFLSFRLYPARTLAHGARWRGIGFCIGWGCWLPCMSTSETIDWATLPAGEMVSYACAASLTNEKIALSRKAFDEIKRRGPEGIQALMDHMHIKNIVVRVHADNIIRRNKDPEFVPVLLSYLDSEHQRTRKYATYLLGYYELPEHADKLWPLLENDETENAAIRSLGKWKVFAAIPRILPYLQHEKEIKRILAVNALRDIADPATAGPLIVALSDPVFSVRMTAARALSALGEEAQVDVLTALDTAEKPARRLLIQVLGDRGDATAIPRLQRYLSATNVQVVAEAANALRVLGQTNTVKAAWISVDEESR
jgi:HEAT repeat protein